MIQPPAGGGSAAAVQPAGGGQAGKEEGAKPATEAPKPAEPKKEQPREGKKPAADAAPPIDLEKVPAVVAKVNGVEIARTTIAPGPNFNPVSFPLTLAEKVNRIEIVYGAAEKIVNDERPLAVLYARLAITMGH